MNQQSVQHIKFLSDRTEINSYDGKKKIYIPSETAKQFHADDSFVKLVKGPYNSGKSTMCAHEIVRRACNMPFWFNGRRRAKWCVVRNTAGELESTTLATFLTWFADLGVISKRQKPILNYEFVFNDGHGFVELEILFLALDRPEDVRKVKSLELSGVYLNELSELPQNVLSHFKGRVNGRYPSKSFCPDHYWSGIICDSNPCDIDFWIYKDFEENPVEGYKLFKQPQGMLKNDDGEWFQNPACDNFANMSSDYYPKLASGQTQNFINVYCLGDWGSVNTDKLVFPDYDDDRHSADNVDAIQGDPLHLAWDFGLTPSCIVGQFTANGRIILLKEYIGEDIGIKNFAESVVIPGLIRDFPYCKVGTSRGDPAGASRNEIMEELSCISELCHVGIDTVPARTNDIEPRLAGVRYFLTNYIERKPRFIISRKGCPMLRRGFLKDYVYKRVRIAGEERYKEIPNKNMASHIQDCVQYLCMDFASDTIAKDKKSQLAMDMFNPVARCY